MEGSEAKFSVPVTFEGNAILEGYPGAALVADGVVSERIPAHARYCCVESIPDNVS